MGEKPPLTPAQERTIKDLRRAELATRPVEPLHRKDWHKLIVSALERGGWAEAEPTASNRSRLFHLTRVGREMADDLIHQESEAR